MTVERARIERDFVTGRVSRIVDGVKLSVEFDDLTPDTQRRLGLFGLGTALTNATAGLPRGEWGLAVEGLVEKLKSGTYGERVERTPSAPKPKISASLIAEVVCALTGQGDPAKLAEKFATDRKARALALRVPEIQAEVQRRLGVAPVEPVSLESFTESLGV